MHLTFAKSQQLGVCIDGARFGRPAREYRSGMCTDVSRGHHSVPPLTVPGASTYLSEKLLEGH